MRKISKRRRLKMGYVNKAGESEYWEATVILESVPERLSRHTATQSLGAEILEDSMILVSFL